MRITPFLEPLIDDLKKQDKKEPIERRWLQSSCRVDPSGETCWINTSRIRLMSFAGDKTKIEFDPAKPVFPAMRGNRYEVTLPNDPAIYLTNLTMLNFNTNLIRDVHAFIESGEGVCFQKSHNSLSISAKSKKDCVR